MSAFPVRDGEAGSGAGRVVVHVGTDRTGTASFQRWLQRHAPALLEQAGVGVYEGRFGADHVELPLLAMRPDRNFVGRVDEYEWCLDAWRADTLRHLRAQLERPEETLLVSAPGLSLLRHRDEVEALRDLLAPREVSVVAVLREPDAYLRSRAAELARQGYHPSRYPDSFAYVEQGSWVTDYEGFLARYREVFGADAVRTVDYESSTAARGSIVPGLIEACGLDASALPPDDDEWADVTVAGPGRSTPKPSLWNTRVRFVRDRPADAARILARRLRRTPSAVPGPDGAGRRAIVHIGMHKTGSTSFQRWAAENARSLQRSFGIHYFEGRLAANHIEFPILTMAGNRTFEHRVREYDSCLPAWQSDMRRRIEAQAARPDDTLLVSAEALDLLRGRDEVERLVELLHPREVSVVVVLRERESFLRSWTGELAYAGFPPSPYRESFAYVGEDAWVLDYDALLDAYGSVLGADHVHAVDYEASLERFGSTTPAILEPFGYAPEDLPNWQREWKNVTTSTKQSRRRSTKPR